MSGQEGRAGMQKEVTGAPGKGTPGERGRFVWPNNGKSSWRQRFVPGQMALGAKYGYDKLGNIC